MDLSLSSEDASMSFSCDPKDLILDLKELVVVVAAGLCYSVNAESKGLWVVIIDGGGRWHSVAIDHKESLPPIN